MVNDASSVPATEVFHGLTGFKLSLFRLARALGVWRAFSWYQGRRFGWSMLPWFDPFDSTHLLFALSDHIRNHSEDHIEINASQFEAFLDPELAKLTGFDAGICFRRLTRELGLFLHHRAVMTSGIARANCIVSGIRDRLLIIDVVHRFDHPPKLTRGLALHLRKAAEAAPVLNAEVIERLGAEAASRDWAFPYEDLILDAGRPIEIILQRRSLFSRLFRKSSNVGGYKASP